MLKFKKNGKIVGILKDESSEPEGEAFKFKDIKEKDGIKTAEPEEGKPKDEEGEELCTTQKQEEGLNKHKV